MTVQVPQSTKFCQEFTASLQEPLAGTATSVQHWISISWPKKAWHAKAALSTGLPPTLAAWQKQEEALHGKMAVRLISKPGISQEHVSIFINPGHHVYTKVPVDAMESVLRAHFAGNPMREFLQTENKLPQLWVCTHGKHDMCCAKFGQKVFEHFRKTIEEQNLAIDLWESSHIGGHRMAATAIAFPSGDCYGRLDLNDVKPILENLISDRVYAPNFRGNCFLPGVEQSIEAAIHHYGFEKNVSYKIMDCSTVHSAESKQEYRVEAKREDGTLEQLRVALILKSFAGPASCTDLGQEVYEPRQRWVLESVKAPSE